MSILYLYKYSKPRSHTSYIIHLYIRTQRSHTFIHRVRSHTSYIIHHTSYIIHLYIRTKCGPVSFSAVIYCLFNGPLMGFNGVYFLYFFDHVYLTIPNSGRRIFDQYLAIFVQKLMLISLLAADGLVSFCAVVRCPFTTNS